MESTLHNPAIVASAARPKLRTIYRTVTTIFCLQMSFTAYAERRLPQVAQEFARLGFPDYLRVELTWAKVPDVLVLLSPASAKLREWAYVGFAITLASALIAHFTVDEGPAAWNWAAGTAVFCGVSYLL